MLVSPILPLHPFYFNLHKKWIITTQMSNTERSSISRVSKNSVSPKDSASQVLGVCSEGVSSLKPSEKKPYQSNFEEIKRAGKNKSSVPGKGTKKKTPVEAWLETVEEEESQSQSTPSEPVPDDKGQGEKHRRHRRHRTMHVEVTTETTTSVGFSLKEGIKLTQKTKTVSTTIPRKNPDHKRSR